MNDFRLRGVSTAFCKILQYAGFFGGKGCDPRQVAFAPHRLGGGPCPRITPPLRGSRRSRAEWRRLMRRGDRAGATYPPLNAAYGTPRWPPSGSKTGFALSPTPPQGGSDTRALNRAFCLIPRHDVNDVPGLWRGGRPRSRREKNWRGIVPRLRAGALYKDPQK